jgi:HEAT repeat protein
MHPPERGTEEQMIMRQLSLLGVGLALALALSDSARGSSPGLTPEQREQAKKWIKQLGDRSYRTREQAAQKLMALGRSAAKLLEEGASDPDLQVSRRCRQLLELASRSDTEVALAAYMANRDDSKLLKLPSWERFSKLVGSDHSAKKLFVEMYCAEGTLLAEMDKDPRGFAPRFVEHCRKIQQTMYTPFGHANSIPHHQVLALLFMATDPNASKDVQSFYALYNLFYQPQVQAGFRDNAGSRKLLMAFLEQRTSTVNAQQVFQIAKQLGLKEALPMAVQTANNKAVQSYTRASAVLFIGQMGAREHIKDLEKLLDDTTSFGTLRLGTATINTQMRDVALAALIMASGQSLSEYNFPYQQQFRGLRGELQLPPVYYGFGDDAARQAALKKWKDSQPKAKK